MITFRGELRGVCRIKRSFDKEPSGLSEGEALILASLIRAPNAMVEDVIKRACISLEVLLNPVSDAMI